MTIASQNHVLQMVRPDRSFYNHRYIFYDETVMIFFMLHVKKQLFINFGDQMVRRFFFNFRIADYEKCNFYFEIIVTLFCIPVIYRIVAQKYFKNASKIFHNIEKVV